MFYNSHLGDCGSSLLFEGRRCSTSEMKCREAPGGERTACVWAWVFIPEIKTMKLQPYRTVPKIKPEKENG
jgi:hypothetical protein